MKITINVNGRDTEIELTPDQVQKVKKATEKITDRVKTFDDVLAELGVSKKQFDSTSTQLSSVELAHRKVELIAKVLNEGWEAEPFNQSQYKYYPYFVVKGNSFVYDVYNDWRSCAVVGSRLCYKSSELATYAGKQFVDIYNDLLK